MNVTSKRTIDFSSTRTSRLPDSKEPSQQFSGDRVDLSGSLGKSADGIAPPMRLGSVGQTKANTQDGALWCTSGSAEVRSNLDDGVAFWCTGGANDVKSTARDGSSGPCFAAGATEVRSNLDDGVAFWCTGGASEVKSTARDGSSGPCFAAGATEVRSNLDDGPFFWCSGAATDVKSKSGQASF